MIELAFVACLAAAGVCGEHRLVRVPETGMTGCMAAAQAQLARWSEAHPDHRVVRWSCRWAGVSDRDA